MSDRNSVIGQVPVDWSVVPIGTLAQERDELLRDREPPMVMAVTKSEGMIPSKEYFQGRQIFSRDLGRYKLVRRNDFAYSTIHIDEGAIAVLRDIDEAIISPMYTVFELSSKVNVDYFWYLLKSPAMVRVYGRLGQGSINRRKSVPFGTLAEIQVPLPSLQEQKKIAAILRSIDETIVQTQTVIKYVNQVKQQVTEQLLTYNSESIGFKILESRQLLAGIRIANLTSLGDISYGLTVNEQRRQAVERLPYLRVGNVYRGYLDLTELKEIGVLNGDRERYMLVPGDVLVVEGNADPNQIGRAALWQGEVAECLHQNHILRFRPDPKQVIPEYVMIYLNSRQGQAYFKLNAKTSSGLNTINSSVLGNIPIVVPPLDEQRKLVNVISAVDRRVNKEEVYKVYLEQVKYGLMQKLLSGELRVTV